MVKTTQKPVLDCALLRHLKGITILFNADGGSDEQKAGLMMKPSSVELVPASDRRLYSGVLRNLKIVTRDKPHAIRRVIKRPWSADAFLWSVYSKLIVGQGLCIYC